MKKGKGLKRTGGLTRTTRVKPVNRERADRLYERNFGPGGLKGDFVRGFPCVLCGRAPTEAAHAIARGMGGCGGDASTLVPLDRECHRAYDEHRLTEGQRATVQMAAGVFETRYQEWLRTRDPEDDSLDF